MDLLQCFMLQSGWKQLFFPIFNILPKFRGMIYILAPLCANHTSLNLILTIFCMRIIVNNKQKYTYRKSYDNVVVFSSKVSSLYFTFLIIFMFYKFILLIHYFILILNFNCYLHLWFMVFVFYLCRLVKVHNVFSMANWKINLL